MTTAELYALAVKRNRVLRWHKGFTVGSLRRWLDDRVADGWLVKRAGRYYLTHEGVLIAQALGGELPLRRAA